MVARHARSACPGCRKRRHARRDRRPSSLTATRRSFFDVMSLWLKFQLVTFDVEGVACMMGEQQEQARSQEQSQAMSRAGVYGVHRQETEPFPQTCPELGP